MRFHLFLFIPLLLVAEDNSTNSLNDQKEASLVQPVTYTLPGIVGRGSGGWIGTDHLLNVSPEVSLVVEIIKPPTLQLNFDQESIRQSVLKVFAKDGFPIDFIKESDGPPLPFFDILLMIQEIDGGYALSVQGRLFEKVSLDRVILPEEVTFQAITWEKQNLLIVPTEQLKEQVLLSAKEISEVFISSYRFFERQKLKLK